MRGRGKPRHVGLDETESESRSQSDNDMVKQKNELKRRRISHRKKHCVSSDTEQRGAGEVRKCSETHHSHWIKRADGIEVLCETIICNFRMNTEARLRKKGGKKDGDHIGKDSSWSGSSTEIEVLYEKDACGLRMDLRSKSTRNKEKRNAYPEEHGEHGTGDEILVGKHILEDMDTIRGKKHVCARTNQEDRAEGMRNENAEDDVNSNSLVGKNSNSRRRLQKTKRLDKNTSAIDMEEEKKWIRIQKGKSPDKNTSGIGMEDEMKFFVRQPKKVSKVESTSTETSFDSSRSSSSSSDTEPDDEDFKVENYYSSASEESGSSFADEDDDEDSSSMEVIEDKSNEQGNQMTSRAEHVMEEKQSGKDKFRVSQGKNRERTSGRGGDGICDGVHVGSKHESKNACRDNSLEDARHETDNNIENLKGKKIEQLTKKEKSVEPKQNKWVNLLINSTIEQDEVFEEQAIEPEVQQPCPENFTLAKKFRFEDEEPKPVEKSEEEKMVEALFDELANADMCTSDSSENDNKTKDDSHANDKCTNPCSKGNHDLYLHEEIGLICHHCSLVKREIKYMDPEFAPHFGRGTRATRWGEREKHSVFNGIDLFPGEDDFEEALCAAVGTVWDVIPGIKSKMYEHQKEGFEFLWKNLEGTINLLELGNTDSSQIGGCIISHAPGTGKTLLTIYFLRTYLKLFPSSRPMIIAPASMLLTWEEEFRKWRIDFPFHNINNLEFSGKENKKILESVSASGCLDKDVIRLVKIHSWSRQKSILGISYNLFENLAGEEYRKKKGSKMAPKDLAGEQSENFRKILLELPRLVVMDEGHNPRNSKSCLWNTLLKLQTNRKIILTGTPFQNNFGELFNTLRLVRPATAEVLAKEKTFADMIARRRYNKQIGICFSSSRVEPADKAIEKLKGVIAPFVHVHKGSILQRSLPGLRDSVILLNPQPLQKRLMRLVEDPPRHSSFDYEHKVALISTHPYLFKHCTNDKLRAGIDMDGLDKLRLSHKEGVKTKFVIELVRLSRRAHEKVLVFSQYVRIHELLGEQLEAEFGWEEGRHVIHMHGKQDQKYRQNIITTFNDPQSEAVVLLATTKCCSEGINLVGASRVVLLDVVWNPSVERQAISRAYRLGQQKIVHTYHLMAAGTSEGDKYCRQVEKERLSELVFSSTTNESEKQNNPALDFDDIILQKMLSDESFKSMFEKIIYQPKEANLIESFGLASMNSLVKCGRR